ncbi:serine-threonine rich protein [Rutstroemia sp. NJR-2017a WRK4]|nr:serine-threonine rich protein [Rutstroemia sp. NJR-2017a WRK4]
MKISSISSLSGLFALASAQLYTETIPVVCSGAPPATVTKTVTVTAHDGGAGYSTEPNHIASARPPYVTTSAGTVTSIAYGEGPGSRSSVWVYPTGTGNKQGTCMIYENNIVIQIIYVDINIQIIDGVTQTVTVTKSESPVTTTVIPPTSTTSPPYTSKTTSHNTDPTGSPKTHYVTVGARGKNLYEPNQLNASIGDNVVFTFLARNHTLTQSNFATPCEFNGGFDTGFNQFNPSNGTNITRTYEVKTDKPTWFFCAQTNHCKSGMVLGINPAGKFDKFLDMAKNSGNGTATASGTGVASTFTPTPSGTGSGSAKPTGYYNYPSLKSRSFYA